MSDGSPIGSTPARDWTPEGRGLLVAGLAAFVLLVAYVGTAGGYAFLPKFAAVPALILGTLLARRGWPFVRDWSVFLALVFLFDALRGLVYAMITRFELPVYMGYVIDLERFVLGGRVFPVALQEWLRGAPARPAVDGFLTVVHSTHFGAFILIGLGIWIFRPYGFRRFTTSVVWVVYGGLALYLLVPTVPPWMAAELFQVLPGITHISAEIYSTSVPVLQSAFDVNPVAAMPSLHTAMPTVSAVVAVIYLGWRSWPILLYPLTVYASILYLGEHYLVDVLAGLLLAVIVLAAVCRPGAVRADREAVRNTPRELPWRVPLDQALVGSVVKRALVLTGLAAAAGFATIWMQGPWVPTPRFVERELLEHPEVAARFLADYAASHSGLPGEVERARAMFAQGNGAESVDRFRALAVQRPEDPEPLYWVTFFEVVSGEAEGTAFRDALARLDDYPDRRRAKMYGRLLEAMPQ